jgi:hypothetical protein
VWGGACHYQAVFAQNVKENDPTAVERVEAENQAWTSRLPLRCFSRTRSSLAGPLSGGLPTTAARSPALLPAGDPLSRRAVPNHRATLAGLLGKPHN